MKEDYGGVIWTNHAIERMRERGIKQGDAWATWRNPGQSKHGRAKGSWVYYKTYQNQKIEVVAKKNVRGEWLVLSVWSKLISGKVGHKSLLKLLFEKLFIKERN